MLLILDIGNSNIVGCIYQPATAEQPENYLEVMRVKTADKLTYTDCLIDMNYNLSEYFDKVSTIVLSSVVPNLNGFYIQLCHELFNKDPYIINYKLYNRLPLSIPQPHIIGSDLVANAIAGYDKAPDGCIIVDFGTVLTFTTVSDKAIKGVTFVPGVRTAIDVLFEKTAQLPKIKINPPSSVIGQNTCAAVNSGVFYGYGGLVDRIVEKINEEVGSDLKLFATGGMGALILPYCKTKFDYDIHLTVSGMRKIYDLTK
ncbi:MAG: type III pantothenate kinase [Bacteroidales bacterium]|nr:type III pantothenate kinase [Bacteroidales bacterium]